MLTLAKFRKKSVLIAVVTIVFSFNLLMKTHYDVLELEKNCTAEEIKDSYIKLSKKYHPDINKNSDAHKKFVAVNEAYSVLGKKDSRNRYDAGLMSGHGMSFEEARHSGRMRMQYANYYDYVHAMNMKKYSKYSNSYFNQTRLTAVFFCCILMVIGAGIHLKYARNEKQHRVMVNHRTSLLLQHTKSRAHRQGREQSIQDFANGNLRGVTMSDIEEELDENSYQKYK